MKKFVLLVFSLLLLTINASAQEKKEVYLTDVALRIEGVPVECYNIDNRVYVIAEKFMDFGFEGIFNEKSNYGRALFLNRIKDEKRQPIADDKKNIPLIRNERILQGYATKTDINLMVDYTRIPAYSYNGYLLVAPEDIWQEALEIEAYREKSVGTIPGRLPIYCTAEYDFENRILDVYTTKKKFTYSKFPPKEVYSTDVAVTINGVPVMGYLIDGKICVNIKDFEKAGCPNINIIDSDSYGTKFHLSMPDDTFNVSDELKNVPLIRNEKKFLGVTTPNDMKLKIESYYYPDFSNYCFNNELLIPIEELVKSSKASLIEYDAQMSQGYMPLWRCYNISADYNSENKIWNIHI